MSKHCSKHGHKHCFKHGHKHVHGTERNGLTKKQLTLIAYVTLSNARGGADGNA